MTPECRHIKTSGGKCASPALRDQPWCYYHARQRERAAERRTSPAVPLSHQLSNLEDRGAIQHAITHVLMALADYQIDTKRAGILLYGLQLASTNAKDAEQIVSSAAIAELTRTAEGEEMAPEGATARPQQEESIADILKRELVRFNPGCYEEFIPGQPLRPIENKDLSQKPGGEGGTPSAKTPTSERPPKAPADAPANAPANTPTNAPADARTSQRPTELKAAERKAAGQTPREPMPAQQVNARTIEDNEEDEPQLLAQWPLDEFGHPKPLPHKATPPPCYPNDQANTA